MIELLKKIYKLLAAVGIAAGMILFAFITPLIITGDDFSIYNPSWNGCSKFATITLNKTTILPTPPTFEFAHFSITNYHLKPSTSAIIIIGPTTSFTDDEAEYIKKFLSNGGLLMLADDFGSANSLLSKINTTTRFANTLLVDFAFEKSAEFTVIIKFEPHRITANLTALLLNWPTALVVNETESEDVKILATSTKLSWLDTNLNYTLDTSELYGELPVICIEKYGKGEILFVSDPSLFVNSMYLYQNNSILVENILDYLTAGRDTILIDESHRAGSTPTRMIFVAFIHIDDSTKYFILFLIILIIICISIGLKRITYAARTTQRFARNLVSKLFSRKKKMAEKIDTVTFVSKKHPNWDKKILQKLAEEIDRNSRMMIRH